MRLHQRGKSSPSIEAKGEREREEGEGAHRVRARTG